MWKLSILVLLSFGTSLAALQPRCEITCHIRFAKEGSGLLTLRIQASNFGTIAKAFGFEDRAITTRQFGTNLTKSFEKLGFTEITNRISTNSGIDLEYSYKFFTPSNVLDWLDDNNFVAGKFIKWSDSSVELNFVLAESYPDPILLIFEFSEYTISDANGVLMSTNKLSWRMNENSKGLYLRARADASSRPETPSVGGAAQTTKNKSE